MTTFDVEFLAHELAGWQRQLDAGSLHVCLVFFFFFLITTNGKSIDDERHTYVCVFGGRVEERRGGEVK